MEWQTEFEFNPDKSHLTRRIYFVRTSSTAEKWEAYNNDVMSCAQSRGHAFTYFQAACENGFTQASAPDQQLFLEGHIDSYFQRHMKRSFRDITGTSLLHKAQRSLITRDLKSLLAREYPKFHQNLSAEEVKTLTALIRIYASRTPVFNYK